MNHVFRVIWSAPLGAWQVVSELTSSRGKTKSHRAGKGLSRGMGGFALTACGLLGVQIAYASGLPTGGQVVAGDASLQQSGSELTVHQSSGKAAINWDAFSIGKGNTVTFVQPDSSSVALNRVLGSDVSVIQGALNANGQIFLVNPNGVLFSPTSQVNVGSLVASTLDLTTEDFLAGNYVFSGPSSNAIINQGNISVADGGSVALIAAKIENIGSIQAQGGQVLMGSGSRVRLDLGGPVKLEIEQAALDALIQNSGAIRADGGNILLTAHAAGELASTVINNTGIIQAQTLATGADGSIALLGDMVNDIVVVGGTLDASAPVGGAGGQIDTSAARVVVTADTTVNTLSSDGTAGTWLIDPSDFNVVAGDAPITDSGIGADTLSRNLNTTNVTLQTVAEGNVNIDANVIKTGYAATTLTVKSHNDINVNAAVGSSGGRLNVVFYADQDNNTNGSINFSDAGSITTAGGNFIAGVDSNGRTVGAQGQNFAMAAGSFIDTGAGVLDINVKGAVTLAAESLRVTGQASPLYNNTGGYSYQNNYLSVQANSIASHNTDALKADT